MRETVWYLPRPDGISLYVHDATPDTGPVRGYIVVVVGLHDVIAGGWIEFLDWFSQRGFRCRLYEPRGCARSGGGGAELTDMAMLVDDFVAVCEGMRTSDAPIFAMGYSLSASIALQTSLQQPHRLHGLVMLSPMFKSIVRHADYHRLEMVSRLMPDLRLIPGVDLSLSTRNHKLLDPYLKNELIRKGVPANVQQVVHSALPQLAKSGPDISIPVLILTGDEDRISDLSIVNKFARTVPTHLLTRRNYEGAYHALHAELAEVQSQLWLDIEAWIDAHS